MVGGDRCRRHRLGSYDFPTREMLPIAGLVAFYDERVDVVVDGRSRPRPRTPFSD